MSMHRVIRGSGLGLALAVLSGCSTPSLPNLWPFSEKEVAERDRRPANAVEYRCEQNRVFFVRRIDADAVWLIAPDREVRLAKLPGGADRYGAGRTALELKGAEATLTDPPTAFNGCKRADAK